MFVVSLERRVFRALDRPGRNQGRTGQGRSYPGLAGTPDSKSGTVIFGTM